MKPCRIESLSEYYTEKCLSMLASCESILVSTYEPLKLSAKPIVDVHIHHTCVITVSTVINRRSNKTDQTQHNSTPTISCGVTLHISCGVTLHISCGVTLHISCGVTNGPAQHCIPQHLHSIHMLLLLFKWEAIKSWIQVHCT